MTPVAPARLRPLLLCTAAMVAWVPAASAQDAAAPPVQAQAGPAPAPEPHFIQLRYPRDRQLIVAHVDGLPIWLEQVVQHIDERHYPGFERVLTGEDGTGTPEGTRMLESDLIAPWVRYLTDIRALEAEARSRDDFDEARAEECLSAALKSAFQEYLNTYVEDLARNGHPTNLDERRVKRLLADYQMRHGLACEAQGWIDYLAPDREWTDQELNDFFQDHARYFGGGVTVEHILIQNRDSGTGILLAEEGRIRAASRLETVMRQVRTDGSNFQDLARKYSDDTRTGTDGGVLKSIERFDQRLPTAICRAAWHLQDGQISDVIESQYGWHIVHRVEHVQRMVMLYSEATKPLVRQLMHREQQEDLLFGVRSKHKVELAL